MTIEDMVESGVTFQGGLVVKMPVGEDWVEPVADIRFDWDWAEYEDEPWYSKRPVTYMYKSEFDDCMVIELGEEE